jgi:hypothetical protein
MPLQAVLDLNPKRIRILNPMHVDAELRGTGSDLVVEVPRRVARGERPSTAILICVIEHQRRDERFFVLRELGYTVHAWERWLRENPGATHLPPVIPVVIHNGERPWRSPTSLHALLDLPDVPLDPSLRALLPSMEVVLADLASPDLTRAVLRSRADDADMVSETLLEILQGATRADADALLDDWRRPETTEIAEVLPADLTLEAEVLLVLTHGADAHCGQSLSRNDRHLCWFSPEGLPLERSRCGTWRLENLQRLHSNRRNVRGRIASGSARGGALRDGSELRPAGAAERGVVRAHRAARRARAEDRFRAAIELRHQRGERRLERLRRLRGRHLRLHLAQNASKS